MVSKKTFKAPLFTNNKLIRNSNYFENILKESSGLLEPLQKIRLSCFLQGVGKKCRQYSKQWNVQISIRSLSLEMEIFLQNTFVEKVLVL